MKLLEVQVTHFKSIDDTGAVAIDPEVTCLVGKNESGKTAFLHALAHLKPVPGQPRKFDYELDYPRKDLNKYKARHGDDPDPVVRAIWRLETAEIAAIEAEFGSGCLTEDTFTVTLKYDGAASFTIPYDEATVVKHLVEEAGLPGEHAQKLAAAATLAALLAGAKEIVESVPQAELIVTTISGWRGSRLGNALVDRYLSPQMPEFFYFDDYSILHGRISVSDLERKRDADQLDDGDRTFLALLKLVGAEVEEFESQDNRERLIAALEAAGNEISDELFHFWSQNTSLEVRFDLSGADAYAGPPFDQGNNLQIRIYNGRHRVTVPFDQRSRGFVWFFSFLAYFSELERADDRDVILLLDEPGLNLHATAQGDFLRFINERLAPNHQVIYSTHSPFMIEPNRLDRVRTVEDRENEGTKISDEVLTTSRETVFPLQAALGYTLAQTLFVGADNILVEGPADYVYLTVISEHLRRTGRQHLDPRWVMVPVGGLEKIPTFLALLNQQLNVAAVVDGSKGGLQKLQDMAKRGVIEQSQIVPITNITKTSSADIEDLFEESFYLSLIKASGVGSVGKSKLPKGNRIVKRIEEALGVEYDHYQPARYLMEHPELFDQLDTGTLDRFEALIAVLNQRL